MRRAPRAHGAVNSWLAGVDDGDLSCMAAADLPISMAFLKKLGVAR